MMLIDLRNKNITGKEAENALVKAEITVNKNMVPFDDKSPFVTSGIRIGTPAITTRGLVEEDMETIVELIDRVLMNHTNEAIIEEGSKQVVYVASSTGSYLPREVQTGIQGELFTQVLEGLEEGERVVTVGSFFVDAEYKMKSGR